MRGRRPPFGVVGQGAASAWIASSRVTMWRGQRLGDIGARAKTGIDQPLSLQILQRFGIGRGSLRLDQWLAINREPEPVEVFENALDKLRPAAPRVEIFDPDTELAAARPRMGMAQHRRKGVAEVQPSGRRGGETCDLQDSLHDKGDHGDS